MQPFNLSKSEKTTLMANCFDRAKGFKPTYGVRHKYKRNLSLDEHVTEMIDLACSFGGSVFGSYVRDFVVPKTQLGINPALLDYDNLKFWFKGAGQACLFINKIKLAGGKLIDGTVGSTPDNGMCATYLTTFIPIDIVISPKFPLCDFSVNLLSWNGSELTVNGETNYTVNNICSQIKEHKYDICQAYLQDALSNTPKARKIHAAYEILIFDTRFTTRQQLWVDKVQQAYDIILDMGLTRTNMKQIAMLIISHLE